MKKYQLYLLSLLTGLMLAFAWFPHGWLPLVFVGFIPLLIVEDVVHSNPEKYKSKLVFFTAYVAFLIWNILTVWWIKNASLEGAIMGLLLNALFMAFTFLSFHRIKKRIGKKWGTLIFISIWITFEYLHHRWPITFPWLTLGNAFSDSINLIQWYEFTGVFGGSLWVLLINVLLFSLIDDRSNKKKIAALLILIILPVSISYILLSGVKNYVPENSKSQKIVIIQPNIDPYNEKFSGSYVQQMKKMLEMAAEKTDSTTDYVIFPETAISENVWEDQLEESVSVKMIRNFISNYPKLTLIIGASSAKEYKPGEKLSSTARKFTNADVYYDAYNTAFQFDHSTNIQKYHKSKLVPGVENVPFQFIFKYFESFAIALGGTTGSLGTQEERSVLVSDKGVKTAPVICYESIYSEYVAEYIKNGANFISIITNDGWWGNTPGHIQHLKMGRLRAIENRIWIARSANTGISCFINPTGEILQATEYWVPAVIEGNIDVKNEFTFFTRFGDYIGWISMYTAFLLIIYSWLIRFQLIKKS